MQLLYAAKLFTSKGLSIIATDTDLKANIFERWEIMDQVLKVIAFMLINLKFQKSINNIR